MAALKKLQQTTIGFVSLLLNCIECFISLVFQGLDNDTDKIQWTTNKCLGILSLSRRRAGRTASNQGEPEWMVFSQTIHAEPFFSAVVI